VFRKLPEESRQKSEIYYSWLIWFGWKIYLYILGYTKIFVISYIPGSKPPNILYWISKGTFEIAIKVFKLSGLVISEKRCEMKMKNSLFFKWVKFEVLRGWIKQPDVENLSHKTIQFITRLSNQCWRSLKTKLFLEVQADIFDYDM